MQRSLPEKIFIIFFLPFMVSFYLIYKYPTWFVAESKVVSTFYWLGMSTGFWYSSFYTFVVCILALKVYLSQKSPYVTTKAKLLSRYQSNKFVSIFLSQLIFFYLIPFVFPLFYTNKGIFDDQYIPVNKNAYIYVYNGFTSMSGFFYTFIIIPLAVWFIGKRYCSWFCACGNLAEVIGTTKWGNTWVRQKTPRSIKSQKLEIIQYFFLIFALIFGALLFLDIWNIFISTRLLATFRAVQDLVVDLIFGALIGVGAYPFLGTRIWCRYGCPLAGAMRLFGKYFKSRFKVEANDRCKGLNLCSSQCPMGIDVAGFAHQNKVPTKGSFGLESTPCIGCGGCIDICPTKALSFKKILGR